MVRFICFSVLILLTFLVGCNNTLDYDDDDVAVIVKGKEVTVGELRFLFPDEKLLEFVDWIVIAELAKQEVKKINPAAYAEIDKEDVQAITKLPPEKTQNEGEKSIREFAESQADKLGIEPETYYQLYIEKTFKQSAYMTAYAEEILGSMDDSEEGEARYIEEYDNLLDELVIKYEDEIEILIK